MKFKALIIAMLLSLMLCIMPSAFAEGEDMELFAMTGGIEFVDFALYDADGATNAGLISNSEMSIEVLVKNTKLTSRNYCVFAAVYADDGTMASVDYESGKFEGNSPIDLVYGTEWIKKVNLSVKVPEVTENTVLKVMLFESPKILSPEGNIYYMADKNSVYMCDRGMQIDLERTDDLELWEGYILADPYTEMAENGYDPEVTPEIEIEGFWLRDEYKEYDFIVADCSLVDVTGLFGKKVIAYIGADEDSETGNVMVYGITEKPGANKSVKIDASQLVEPYDREWETENQISYRMPGSDKVYNAKIERNVEVYVNYERSRIDCSNTASISELLYGEYFGGTIELISNDSDAAIEFVLINGYSDEAVIKSVKEKNGVYSFEVYNNGLLDRIDVNDEDVYCEVYKDGVKTDVSAITVNDTVSEVLIGGDGDMRMLFVSSETVEGTLESYDEDSISINGKDYRISLFYGKATQTFKDATGIFYLNAAGEVAYYRSTEVKNYAMVLAVDHISGISDKYVMHLMMADGKVCKYDIATNAKFYEYNSYGNAEVFVSGDVKVADIVSGIISDTTDFPVRTQVGRAVEAVFTFEIKDDKITKIKTLEGETTDRYLVDNDKRYESVGMYYGLAGFDEKTVVFLINIPYTQGRTAIEADDVKVGTVSDFFNDGDSNLIFAGLDTDDEYISKAVVGFDFKATIPEKGDTVVVTKTMETEYNGNETCRVFGMRGGSEVSFIIYEEDEEYTNAYPQDLEAGDVIMISNAKNGIVADFKLLYDARSNQLSQEAVAGVINEDVYNAAGRLDNAATEASEKRFFIDVNVENSSGAVWAFAEDGIVKKAFAKYTLVDFTQSEDNPVVSLKTKDDIFDTSGQYETYVFVRVYDELLSEVVVYRYNAEGRSYIETFTDIVEAVDGDYIATPCDVWWNVSENCTFTDANGNVVTGSTNVTKKLSSVIEKNITGALCAYEFTANRKNIESIREISLTEKIAAENCAFNQSEYKIGELQLSAETSVVVLTYDDNGKIVTAEGTSADILAEEKCDVLYYTEDGTVKLAAILKKQAPINYGMVLAVGYESGIRDSYVMQIKMADGTVSEYELASKVKFYEEYSWGYFIDDEAAAVKVAEAINGYSYFPARLKTSRAVDSVFSFEFKDEKIAKIRRPQGGLNDEYLNPNSEWYKAENMTYGSVEFANNAVVFAFKDTYNSGAEVRAEDVSVGKVSDFFHNGDTFMFGAFTDEKAVSNLVVGFGFNNDVIREKSDAIIITKTESAMYKGNESLRIFGLQGGNEVTYLIDEYYDMDFQINLEAGDIIITSSANDDGAVASFMYLYDASENWVSAEALDGKNSEGVFNGAGNLDKEATKASSSKFYIDTDIRNSNAVFARSEEGVVKTTLATYTLVDYTQSVIMPNITQKSPTEIFDINDDCEMYVFVRVYDNSLKEVVVYRYNANGERFCETFTSVLEDVDEGYIVTSDGEEWTLSENCTFTDVSGNVVTGSAEVTTKLSAIIGKSFSDELCAYELTANGGMIESIREVKLTGKITAENCTFNQAEYKIGELKLTDKTAVVLLTYSSDGKIVKTQRTTADILADEKSEIVYCMQNDAVEAVAILREQTPLNYGMVLAVDYSGGISSSYVMQIMMADGKLCEYELDSKAKFYSDNSVIGYNDERTAEEIAMIISGQSSFIARLQAGRAIDSVFTFEFRNGKIVKIKTLDGGRIDTYLSANAKKYDADNMCYGSVEFDEQTVVFSIGQIFSSNSTWIVESDEIEAGKVSGFFTDNAGNLIFAGLDENNGICRVVVGFDLKPGVPEDSDAVIVTNKKIVSYEDDDAVQIMGIRAGEEVSFIIYDEENEYTNAEPEDIDKGDVIIIAPIDDNGVTDNFKFLYDASEKRVSDEAFEGDAVVGIYNAAGILNKDLTRETTGKFFIDADVKNNYGIFASAYEGITIKASANYTLVDYTESTRNPEICKKSSESVFNTSSKYNTHIFLRVYENNLAEAVCYRTNAY